MGSDLDVFYASNTINFIILSISAGAINSAITPLLIKHYKNGEIKNLAELASSLFNIIFLLFLIFGFLQYFFAEEILKSILPGFSDTDLHKVFTLFKIQAFLSIITILSALLLALHYTYKKFYRTIIYPIIGQIVQLLFVWCFHKKFGILSLVYSLVLSQILTFIFYSISFVNLYRFKIVINQEFKNACKKIFPLFISSGFYQSNTLIDRFFASTLSSGSITLLQYGEKITKIISNFINNGVSLVSLRKFSFAQDDEVEFQRLFYSVFKTMIFIVLPVAFMIIFFLKDALNIIAVSNKLSYDDVNKIYLVTVAFIGIFIGGSLNSTITNAFYAKGLTKLVSKVDVGLQIFGIGLKIGLFYLFGFWGLPVAVSVNSLLGVIILFILYGKYIYAPRLKALVSYLAKIIVISTIAVILPKVLSTVISDFWLYRLMINSFLFTVIFIYLSIFYEKDVAFTIYLNVKDTLQKRK